MKQALAGGDGDRAESVRQHLNYALRRRSCLQLEPLSMRDERPLGKTLAAQVEMLRDEDFIINQPSLGGCTYPLAVGEKLRLTLFSGIMRLNGDTKCLGRIKLPSGSGGTFYGYRMALPAALKPANRRDRVRVPTACDLAVEAELRPCSDGRNSGTVRGVLHDLSTTGVKVRSRNADGRVTTGMRMFLHTVLPDPMGELNEMVVVRYIGKGEQRDQVIIGAQFEREIERLETFIRTMDVKRAGRTRRLA